MKCSRTIWVSRFYFLMVFGLVVGSANLVSAQANGDDSKIAKQAITKLLGDFRDAAKKADGQAYFNCLAKDGIFFGTDGNERFTVDQLKAFVGPYFDRGIGWEHQINTRRVFVGPNNQVGWFEEQTTRQKVGPMRTTGVVKKTKQGWKIVQYNVAIVVPNDVIEDVVKIIKQREQKNLGNADNEKSAVKK